MRKIALLTDHFPSRRGGFSRYVQELTRHWAQMGWEVFVFTTLPQSSPHSSRNEHRKLIPIARGMENYLGVLLRFLHFLRAVNRLNISLLFFPVWHPYGVYLPFLRFFSGRRYRIVIGTHGAEILALFPGSSFPEKPIFKALGRLALRRADRIFAISHFTAGRVRELGVPANKIYVFPNGVDAAYFRPLEVDRAALFRRYQLPSGQSRLLLTVAQLNARKGIDTAIQAVHRLRQKGYPLIYVVIGTGPDAPRLRQLIQQLGLGDAVFLLSGVGDQDLLQFYNAADIFLLLSRQEDDYNVEGFGLVLLEAAACELPVIAGRSGGIPDAVAHGETGFLVPPTDLPQITRRIQQLLDQPELARQMGRKARQRVLTRFNWQKICAEMCHQFEQLLAK